MSGSPATRTSWPGVAGESVNKHPSPGDLVEINRGGVGSQILAYAHFVDSKSMDTGASPDNLGLGSRVCKMGMKIIPRS